MKVVRWLLILFAFVLGCEIGTNLVTHYDIEGAQAGIIFEDVTLESGATDGDDELRLQ